MKNKIELKYIEQRWEGWEGWIGNDNSFWIRLDFLLEYYISRNVDLSKKIKDKTPDLPIVKQYSEQMASKFMKMTSDGKKFSYKNYSEWLKMTNPEIKKALNLIKN